MQIKSLSREKIKVAVWIGVIALVALIIAQLFQSINADQIVSPATFGPPQYPVGAAIDGVAVLDTNTMSTDSKGVITYDCDSKGIGATIALYKDDGSEPTKITTDGDCRFFDNVAVDPTTDGTDVTACAFAAGMTVPATPSEILPPNARYKCAETQLAKYTDNYVDLDLITPVPGMEHGLLNVFTKDERGNIAVGMTVNISCSIQKDFPTLQTNSEGKATFMIVPPGQSCDIEVSDYSNVKKTANATVNKFPPETNVTVKVANTTPAVTFIKSLFSVQKAHAAPGKKTMVRPTVKNVKTSAANARKVTQAEILGSLTNDKGQSVAGVRLKLTRIRPDVVTINDFGQEERIPPQIAITNAQGQFSFSAIKFTVNVENEYKIEIDSLAYESTPEVKIWGTPATTKTITLHKDMKGKNPATSNEVTPYKQGGVQIVAQSKDLPSLKGQTGAVDANTNLTTPELMGKFTVKEVAEPPKAAQEFAGTSSFVLSNPKLATYTIFFEPTDPTKVEVEGYYDANNPTVALTAAAGGNAASVTLTETKKNASVLVKLKKITAVGLSGETLKIGTVSNDRGTFTITPANATFPKTNAFSYKFAKLDETYGVDFDPDNEGVEVEGYYDASDLNTKIDNTKITLTVAKPVIKVIVKLKQATTSLDIKLLPPKENIVTYTVNQNYEDTRPKKAKRDNIIDMRIKGAELVKKYAAVKEKIKDIKLKETEIHMSYRIPNADIKVSLDNKEVGTTGPNGLIKVKDATAWIDAKPEVKVEEMPVIPACHHVHTQVSIVGIAKGGTRVAYTRGTMTYDLETPVLGKITGGKIKSGANNEATINKLDFEPENFNQAFENKTLHDDNFFDHQEKLNRCLNGKPLTAPIIKTATLTPNKEVKLRVGETGQAVLTWEMTEADGKPINDPSIKASLEIRSSREGGLNINKPIGFSGSETIPLSLKDKDSGRDYTIVLRITGTQNDKIEKKFDDLKTIPRGKKD